MANRRFVQRSRRPVFWVGANFLNLVGSGTNVVSSIQSEAELENVPNSTLIRIRGECLVIVDTASATPSRAQATLGIKFATTAAFTGGTVEGPNSSIGSDWIWWSTVSLQLESGTVGSPGGDGTSIVKRVEIDSKAMRKTPLNAQLIFASENSTVTALMSFDVLGTVRLLFKR